MSMILCIQSVIVYQYSSTLNTPKGVHLILAMIANDRVDP